MDAEIKCMSPWPDGENVRRIVTPDRGIDDYAEWDAPERPDQSRSPPMRNER